MNTDPSAMLFYRHIPTLQPAPRTPRYTRVNWEAVGAALVVVAFWAGVALVVWRHWHHG